MPKNPAAQSLGRKRWKGKTKEQKRAHAMKMVAGRKLKGGRPKNKQK